MNRKQMEALLDRAMKEIYEGQLTIGREGPEKCHHCGEFRTGRDFPIKHRETCLVLVAELWIERRKADAEVEAWEAEVEQDDNAHWENQFTQQLIEEQDGVESYYLGLQSETDSWGDIEEDMP